MKYSYREGIDTRKSHKWLLIFVGVSLVVIYMISNYFAPAVLYVTQPGDTTAKRLVSDVPSPEEDKLYIPKINATVPIADGTTDETSALVKGAMQKYPDSGDPKNGGNYVLTADRFKLGLEPRDTFAKSPFYHLDKLGVDDDVYVDFEGERYAYKITKTQMLSQSDETNFSRTKNKTLTVYSAHGSSNRILTAKMIGKVVWTSGQPQLQSLED